MALFKKNRHHKKAHEETEKEEWLQTKGQLAADVYETEKYFCVQVPIAGVSQEEIEIFVENNMLVIKGERKEADQSPDKKYYHQECYWGPFFRNTMLPSGVNSQKITAAFKKGILTIKIPKKEED